jgi:hypothetical protein
MNMHITKVNSFRIIPLNSNSNDCIKEYNYFYGLVDSYYPKKTSSQKVYMALDLCKISSYKRITKHKYFKVDKKKKKKSCFKMLKKLFSC